MGDFVNDFTGKYITSFDAGTTLDDVRTIGQRTPYVGGIQEGAGNASASTAKGVYFCISAAVRLQLKATDLKGVRVAIQGAGNVGARLAVMLSKAQAIVTIADVDMRKAEAIAAKTGATIESPDRIHTLDVDVYAPCALGGVITDDSIPQIQASIVAGGANNQLLEARHADGLQDAGILYCPDYLANAGGIIDLHYQRPIASRKELNAHLMSLGNTLEDIILRSKAAGKTTLQISDEIVHERLHKAKG
ncbi:2-dehydropantoate 2-reductase N-terminal domain-containing protein [Kordiimonas pumila]|uniref:2-dehydropantoate 2-reductase N-terminal domain-containing protein n=1 Tax=Kordiimonas pumila TaxID=2161677 RepID=A0ABV7D6C3_9PROT|nr:2-dehydropantoate 2-reductase N-terminal domain-containing protein [Kordiimonas pumila]